MRGSELSTSVVKWSEV